MVEPNLERRSFEARLLSGPLNEGDQLGTEVVIEQRWVLTLKALQSVEIQVRDAELSSLVALPERKGR